MSKPPAVVRELVPNEANPRTITDARSKQLAKSMGKWGDLSGVVWNQRTKRLVCGHQRIRHLAANAKIRTQPAKDEFGTVAIGHIVSGARASWNYRIVDWDEETEKGAVIAANAHGGDFDDDKLRGLVLSLDQSGFEMDLLGLKSLEAILKEEAEKGPAGAEDDVSAAPKKVPVKLGDLFTLGEHRLLCGDSTSRTDVQRLMGHDVAACVYLDPPYGVSYIARSGDHDMIEGDAKRDDELLALVAGALKQASHFSVAEAAFYIWHASSTRRDFDDAIRAAGLVEKQYLIWVKNAIVLGHADYHWAHEPIFYCGKAGQKTAFYGDRAQPTVWRATLKKRAGLATTLGQAILLTDGHGGQVALTPRLPKGKKTRTQRLTDGQTILIETASNGADVIEVGRDQDHYIHPNQKPVELCARAVGNSSKPGDVILDLFSGSGSTIMACEATGRRGRACDNDPKYIWAAVLRREEATGRKAVREGR